MNLKDILKVISPTYNELLLLKEEIRSNRELIKSTQNKLKQVNDKVESKEIERIVEESIVNKAEVFTSAVSNMLEMHLYNIGITREETKNKPLFILGSGPSLKDVDVSKLKNCYTMSFNRSYIAFKDWGFDPTYYAAIDHVVNEDNKEEIKELIDNSNVKRFFFSRDKLVEDNFTSPKTTIVQIGPPNNPNLDFTKRLRTSNTGLFGLQVALGILGFKEVYLLGCDANYEEKVKGVKIVKGQYVSNSNNDINHFRSDYFGKGKKYNKPFGNLYHYPAWKSFYEQVIKNNSSGFKVYNCSKIGRLTFFEFKDIDEVIKSIHKYEIKK